MKIGRSKGLRKVFCTSFENGVSFLILPIDTVFSNRVNFIKKVSIRNFP